MSVGIYDIQIEVGAKNVGTPAKPWFTVEYRGEFKLRLRQAT
jgi:hypothetical protein